MQIGFQFKERMILWFASIFFSALVAVDCSRSLPEGHNAKQTFNVDVDADGGVLLEQAEQEAPTALTRHDRFDMVHKQFRRKYLEFGRLPRNSSQRAISLSFEVETLGQPQMTPDLLLLRSGIDVGLSNGRQSNTCAGNRFTFPNPSPFFSVGLDDTELQLQAKVEVTTAPMQPQEILSSGMLQDVQSFFDQSRYGTRIINGSEGTYTRPGSTKSCKQCKVHYTVGLPLANIPSLFAFSTYHKLRQVISRLDNLCRYRVGGCHADYKGLVALASWVMKNAHSGCPSCWTPEQCIFPWLVRTHFGDSARYVAEQIGEDKLANLTKDVLYVAEVQPHSAALPGVPYLEHLLFPEYVELAGLVAPRHSVGTDAPFLPELPTTSEGLCALANKMLKSTSKIDKILRTRTCAFHGLDRDSTIKLQRGVTTHLWLEEMKKGKDLLSDHDSPLSNVNWTRVVWKSMGRWRMSNATQGIIYLQCRSPWCLTAIPGTNRPVETMRRVTSFFVNHSDTLQGSFEVQQDNVPGGKGMPNNAIDALASIGATTGVPEQKEASVPQKIADRKDYSSARSASPTLEHSRPVGSRDGQPTATSRETPSTGTGEDSRRTSLGMLSVFSEPWDLDGVAMSIDDAMQTLPLITEPNTTSYSTDHSVYTKEAENVRLVLFILIIGYSLAKAFFVKSRKGTR